MKSHTATGRKLRYGSVSVILAALVIAIVIAFNALATMLVQRYNLYLDLTPDLHFTISDECYDLIGKVDPEDGVDTPIEMLNKFRAENGGEKTKINILFCKEIDKLMETANSSETGEAASDFAYVYLNAKELQTKYPDYISVECIDGRKNYSRLSKYLSSNVETISLDSVIIEYGTEFRIRPLDSFYVVENGVPVGYNGEKAFASSILAVTRAESPLACYTVNHGEAIEATADATRTTIKPLLAELENAGYKTQPIDLEKEAIPEACRIVVVFDPKEDFRAGNDGISTVNEFDKLDDFLADRNALMVFMNPTSYDGVSKFENLEEFLGEWGLAFKRHENEPVVIRDTASVGSATSTQNIVAQFAKNPLANGWTESMTANATKAPTIVAPNSVALTYANGYNHTVTSDEDNNIAPYTIGYSATYNRTVFDLFVASETAKGYAGSQEVAQSSKTEPVKIMAIAVETHYEQEYLQALEDSAYVMLCGSTDFASEYALRNYGNGDFMLIASQMSGRDPVPVGLKYKEFANYTIKTIESGDATQYTIVLTVVPVVIALLAGVFVIVRRKYR